MSKDHTNAEIGNTTETVKECPATELQFRHPPRKKTTSNILLFIEKLVGTFNCVFIVSSDLRFIKREITKISIAVKASDLMLKKLPKKWKNREIESQV